MKFEFKLHVFIYNGTYISINEENDLEGLGCFFKTISPITAEKLQIVHIKNTLYLEGCLTQALL